jgi:hypothetical protein
MNTGNLIFFANYTPSNFNNKLSCFFNFEDAIYSSNLFSSLGKDSNIISGQVLPNTGQFWTQKQNTAFISGNYIKINNLTSSSINLKNFTYILSFEKLSKYGGVLLSCIQKNTGIFLDSGKNLVNKEYFEGFEFGVTANNYLYFEYFKNDGVSVLVNKNKINDKSVAYLSINNNNINFGYYDFLNQTSINDYYNISSNYLFNPQNLYIGYNPQAINLYSNNQNFVGYIEDIMFTSPALFNYELINLSSGYVYDFTSESQYVSSFIITGVTGTFNQLTGYRTEITGWETIETGTVTDDWGFTVMGYIEQPLIVQIPLSGTFNLSGEILVSTTGFSGVEFNINNEKLISYQKNVINFLNKIDNQDLIEFRSLNSINNFQINNKNIFIPYERYGNFYINNLSTPFYNLFVNGQLQRSGEILIVTDPYNNTNTRIIENDFGVDSNNNVFFNNFYGLKGDSSIILESTNGPNIYLGEAENLQSPIFVENINSDLFLNGQKLTTGIHYTVNFSTNNFILNNELSLTGSLIAVPQNFNFNQITSGTPILNLNNNFYFNNTEVYVNGVRQSLNYDYFELSKFDISTGIKILLENNKDYIYNNEGFIK